MERNSSYAETARVGRRGDEEAECCRPTTILVEAEFLIEGGISSEEQFSGNSSFQSRDTAKQPPLVAFELAADRDNVEAVESSLLSSLFSKQSETDWLVATVVFAAGPVLNPPVPRTCCVLPAMTL